MAKQMYSQLQEELTRRTGAPAQSSRPTLPKVSQIVNSVQEVPEGDGAGAVRYRQARRTHSQAKTSNKKLKDSLSVAMKELDDLRHNDSGSLLQSARRRWIVPRKISRLQAGSHAILRGTNTTSPENPDFGYVEPPRRPRQPDSDAQTTLF